MRVTTRRRTSQIAAGRLPAPPKDGRRFVIVEQAVEEVVTRPFPVRGRMLRRAHCARSRGSAAPGGIRVSSSRIESRRGGRRRRRKTGVSGPIVVLLPTSKSVARRSDGQLVGDTCLEQRAHRVHRAVHRPGSSESISFQGMARRLRRSIHRIAVWPCPGLRRRRPGTGGEPGQGEVKESSE